MGKIAQAGSGSTIWSLRHECVVFGDDAVSVAGGFEVAVGLQDILGDVLVDGFADYLGEDQALKVATIMSMTRLALPIWRT